MLGSALTSEPIDPLNDLSAYARGRLAFWNGRVISENPHVETLAEKWRMGWKTGVMEFLTRGGQPEWTLADLRRLSHA